MGKITKIRNIKALIRWKLKSKSQFLCKLQKTIIRKYRKTSRKHKISKRFICKWQPLQRMSKLKKIKQRNKGKDIRNQDKRTKEATMRTTNIIQTQIKWTKGKKRHQITMNLTILTILKCSWKRSILCKNMKPHK